MFVGLLIPLFYTSGDIKAIVLFALAGGVPVTGSLGKLSLLCSLKLVSV